MVDVDVESELLTGLGDQRGKELVRGHDGGAALLADEVTVRSCRQVVRGWSVTEMGVGDHSEALEFIEIAIDRGEGDVRGPSLDGRGKILSGVVIVSVEECVDEQPAASRDSTTMLTNEGQGLVGGHDGMLMSVGRRTSCHSPRP